MRRVLLFVCVGQGGQITGKGGCLGLSRPLQFLREEERERPGRRVVDQDDGEDQVAQLLRGAFILGDLPESQHLFIKPRLSLLVSFKLLRGLKCL